MMQIIINDVNLLTKKEQKELISDLKKKHKLCLEIKYTCPKCNIFLKKDYKTKKLECLNCYGMDRKYLYTVKEVQDDN